MPSGERGAFHFRADIFLLSQLQAWDAYKQSISEFWITESWTPEGDKSHWVLFEESDKQTLRILLAFMAAVVKTHANCTLFVTVVRQVKLPEAQHFFAFQSIVCVHSNIIRYAIHSHKQSAKIFTVKRLR